MRLLRRARPASHDAPVHPAVGAAATQMVANLLLTADGTVHAGYRIAPVRWDYTGQAAKEALLDAVQDGWALTVGRTVHERVTTRPFPAHEWARRLDARTPAPLPDVHTCDPLVRLEIGDAAVARGECGCETWDKHLLRQQHRIAAAGMDEKVVFRYFTVGQVPPGYDLRADVAAWQRTGARPPAGVRAVLDTERRLADALTVSGWRASRMSEREQAWLRHRSLAVGAPAPELAGDWSAGDVAALSASVRWVEEPLDYTLTVHALRHGRVHTRAVQVLTCARLDDLAYPANGLEPWMVYAERATDAAGHPFPIEWSLNGRVVPGEELRAQAERDLRLAGHLHKTFTGFEEEPPEYTERGIARAKVVRDQVSTGATRDSARFVGTINMIVSGEAVLDDDGRVLRSAEEVCLERADAAQRLFAGADLRMDFVAPPGQAAWLAQVVPGEPFLRHGFRRQEPLGYLAAAMPNVSAAVGDGAGPYDGYTRGAARRVVLHDSHYATEGRGARGRGANIWVQGGTLGAGKSVSTGHRAYQSTRRGIATIVRDPAGPLLRLGEMPEIAPFFNGVDVTRGEDGTLNPPSLVREPRREEFDTDARHARAVVRAQGERAGLVRDVARRALEHDLYGHPATIGALRDAARTVTWTQDADLWQLLDALRAAGDAHSAALADSLTDASERPLLSLLFAPRRQGGDFARLGRRDAVLTVISTPGIKRASDSTARGDWTSDELAADPVIYLTGLYTAALVYDKPMATRAALHLDEAEDLTDGAAGRALLTRLGRDHSKWNLAVYLSLKNVNESILGPEMRNYLGGAWVGRTATQAPAEAFLDVLTLEDKAYARSLMRLSQNVPGEWVHLDADRRVGGMVADVGYHPQLAAALFNDPAPQGAQAWAVEEALG